MFQLENRRFDEIWYGRYAIEGYPKFVLFNFVGQFLRDYAAQHPRKPSGMFILAAVST
jgi:hypothetical protein